MKTKRVLVITYYFPPVGGAGVQRVTKFVRYLQQFGWEPTVLTVSNPSVPVFDRSLEQEVPESVAVHTAKTLEPGYQAKQLVSSSENAGKKNGILRFLRVFVGDLARLMLQPDPQILWLPAARKKARQLVRNNNYDAILVTAPPFSPFLLGAWLSKSTGIPLVLDYRDEWDISSDTWENKKSNFFTKFVNRQLQKYVLRRASAIIATTLRSASSLQKLVDASRSRAPVSCIYNGYDSQDLELPQIEEKLDKLEKYRLSYIGTLWNLTSVKPLVDALLELHQSSPALLANMEFAVAGRQTEEQSGILSQLSQTAITLTNHGYLSHEDALSLMKNSHGLLILLSANEHAERVVPAKTFEYMACRGKIINIGPKGEVWDLLENLQSRLCFVPEDISGIATGLKREVELFMAGNTGAYSASDTARFERVNLTGELAQVLNQVVSMDSDQSG